jgi:hypothetical protein
MNERREVGKSSENTGWRGPEGAQAYLAVRRASGGSMPVFSLLLTAAVDCS